MFTIYLRLVAWARLRSKKHFSSYRYSFYYAMSECFIYRRLVGECGLCDAKGMIRAIVGRQDEL